MVRIRGGRGGVELSFNQLAPAVQNVAIFYSMFLTPLQNLFSIFHFYKNYKDFSEIMFVTLI